MDWDEGALLALTSRYIPAYIRATLGCKGYGKSQKIEKEVTKRA